MTGEKDTSRKAIANIIDKIRDDATLSADLNKRIKAGDDLKAALKKMDTGLSAKQIDDIADCGIETVRVCLNQELESGSHDVSRLLDDIRYDRELASRLSERLGAIGDLGMALREKGYCVDERDKTAIARFLDLRTSSVQRERELSLNLQSNTLNEAATTFVNIRNLATAVFIAGFLLFVFAAVTSLITKDSTYGFVLGGLGTADFVGLMLYRPMDRQETALSDLVQSIIIFMNFNQQMSVCQLLSRSRDTLNKYDKDALIRSCEILQKATNENVRLCQEYLEPVTVGAPSTAPKAAPTVTAATPGDRKAILTWKAPDDDGGSPISGYNVYQGTTPGGERLIGNVGNALTYTDDNLENGKVYYYVVSSVNSVGESPKSKEISVTAGTPSAPTIKPATPGDGKVDLEWDAPASDGGDEISAYKVYRGTESGKGTPLEDQPQGTPPPHKSADSKATNGQKYYYTVSAVNSKGEGPQSNEVQATPKKP